ISSYLHPTNRALTAFIDFSTVANSDYYHHKSAVVHLIHDTILTNADTPSIWETAQLYAARRSGIGSQLVYPNFDSGANRVPEFYKCPTSTGRKAHFIRHGYELPRRASSLTSS